MLFPESSNPIGPRAGCCLWLVEMIPRTKPNLNEHDRWRFCRFAALVGPCCGLPRSLSRLLGLRRWSPLCAGFVRLSECQGRIHSMTRMVQGEE